MEQAPKVEGTSSGTSAFSAGLGTANPDHATYHGPWGRFNSSVIGANGEDLFIVRNTLTGAKLGCYDCNGYLTMGQADAVIAALNKYDCLHP